MLHDGATVYVDRFEIPGNFRVEGDGEERKELAREIDSAGDGPGDDGSEWLRLREKIHRGDAEDTEETRRKSIHGIGSPDLRG
jgi:hypothetical protein